eukprot:TRINITY_DN27652_c0_g1_i2.p1 TRINITY_DN27652_c0_g1~~TRINITY_DN27652_c0_g1_i2.p1  ORF type:complete len:477 (+),score=86.47 TRINITY_DN27652_c0_g1_i2:160-1431(+)
MSPAASFADLVRESKSAGGSGSAGASPTRAARRHSVGTLAPPKRLSKSSMSIRRSSLDFLSASSGDQHTRSTPSLSVRKSALDFLSKSSGRTTPSLSTKRSALDLLSKSSDDQQKRPAMSRSHTKSSVDLNSPSGSSCKSTADVSSLASTRPSTGNTNADAVSEASAASARLPALVGFKNGQGSSAAATKNVPVQPPSPEAAKAQKLARVFRLPAEEVVPIVEAFENAPKNAGGTIGEKEFYSLLASIFEGRKPPKKIAKEAFHECKGKDGVELNLLLEWYVQNLFGWVAELKACPIARELDTMVKDFAKTYQVPPATIDKIKADFDRFDENKNGLIEYSEFQKMIYSMLRADHGDLSTSRIQRFWNEIDIHGDGTVSFKEFATWYLKYFKGEGKGGDMIGEMVNSLYDQFNPITQRRKALAK